MAELEVDQSNLPRVQEVSQYFSVLEDGALAHNLQEQEIEQFYSSNVQRNQLVQKDIRVAKRLQNEEQHRAQMLREQTTRQLEEQDSEYARRIQEEIQRAAEEQRKREEKDEEIAKQIQEEEELYIRQRNSCRRTGARGERVNRPSLDLGELRQVLQDEELAHRLQAEEEELLRVDLASAAPLERSYPKGDFTVAQVAQDEEIARFMQKQEIKAQLRSQELEESGSGRGYGEMSHAHDNTEVNDRQMSRERLNSEGLMSPGDECSLERQLPSPVTLEAQQHPFRNVAEDLDPTFQRKDDVQAVQSISGTSEIQTPQAWSCEEPAFVAPTKRHNEKAVRAKSKEKKENSKSKENCKQQ